MTGEDLSIIVKCWHDLRSDAAQLRVVMVDSGQEVQLSDGSFLLRVLPQDDPAMLRFFIRHISSGREAYIQGGSHLRDFVEACLLQVPAQSSGAPAPLEREDPQGRSQADGPEAGSE